MTRLLALGWALLLALLVAVPAAAQPAFPKLTGRVVDQARLLAPAQVVDIESKLAALEAASGRQLVVATVPSLGGRTIEDYGYQLGRTWGIGDKDKDDGVILLVAPTERKVRIETGYGARVFLTDAVSSIIVREAILPKFRAGDMAGGIVAGVDQIVGFMKLPAAEAAKRAAEAGAREKQRDRRGGSGFPFVLIGLIFFFFVLPMLRAGRGRRYHKTRGRSGIDPWIVLWGLDALDRSSRSRGGWGGGGGFGGGGFGGGGGGFGGFSGGGGSFGGGGASGGW